ncbi:MAG: 3-dehydroquinate synthase [Planctomycetes bacterium]|nr:3-dehydroquinate synthase [Planctomycetota bacterium]
MNKIPVNLGERSYQITIGKNILSQLGDFIIRLTKPCKTLIITDKNVNALYADIVSKGLAAHKFDVKVVSMEPGEEKKTLSTVEVLYDAFFDHGMDRKSLVIALGGGVVGDVAGFAASTFMRGVPFVQVPTSLLAQVDSSVGGKVGVNHPRGKNMIGSFYQPIAVFIDTVTLSTLPRAELLAGMVEVIKYGVIRDASLFDYVEKSLPKILELNDDALKTIISKSCNIKARVVEEDEREAGLRAILNYGHTIGHALEALTEYKKYRHGEAVAIGMAYASKMAVIMGLADETVSMRQISLLKRLGMPTENREIKPDDIINTLYLDKKTLGGRLRFILPTKIGEVIISDKVTEEVIRRTLE